MSHRSTGSITIRPTAGVMALMCTKCEQLNQANFLEGGELAIGTLLIPVTLEQKAAVEAGYYDVRRVQCHQFGHPVTVHLQMM